MFNKTRGNFKKKKKTLNSLVEKLSKYVGEWKKKANFRTVWYYATFHLKKEKKVHIYILLKTLWKDKWEPNKVIIQMGTECDAGERERGRMNWGWDQELSLNIFYIVLMWLMEMHCLLPKLYTFIRGKKRILAWS